MPLAALSVLSLLCALLIGYAAHRASLCNVRAVAEIMNSGLRAGRSLMLWSLLQAVLWMATLTGVLVLFFGVVPQPATARIPIGWALVGGGLFGLGAAINGGCSLSTLHRLADGELGMVATLTGFVLGVLLWLAIGMGGGAAGMGAWLGGPMLFLPVASPWLRWPALAPWLLAGLLVWVTFKARALWQLAKGWQKGSGKISWRDWLLAPAYHVSVAAAVIGLAAGLLYATQGAWSYTNYIRSELQYTLGDARAPSVWHGLLLTALLLGMAVSALQRRSLKIRAPAQVTVWLRHLGGGTLMGIGAAMIPGGNDTLLLSGLPALTATAAGAYAFMLIGIAAGLSGLARLRANTREMKWR